MAFSSHFKPCLLKTSVYLVHGNTIWLHLFSRVLWFFCFVLFLVGGGFFFFHVRKRMNSSFYFCKRNFLESHLQSAEIANY